MEIRQIPLLQRIPSCPGTIPNSMQHLSQGPWGLWQQMVWQQSNTRPQGPFLLFHPLEGGQLWDCKGTPLPSVLPPSTICPKYVPHWLCGVMV